MKYLFDTDTCISLLDNRDPAKQRNILARLAKLRRFDIALSSITVSELVLGAENGVYKNRSWRRWIFFFSTYKSCRLMKPPLAKQAE